MHSGSAGHFELFCLSYTCYRPTLKGMESDADSMDGVIGRASQLAESVSCKVRVLDLAKVCSLQLMCT